MLKSSNENPILLKNNRQGKREYAEDVVMVLEKLVSLSKYGGMTLEKDAKTEESKETDLIPFHIQQQLQGQYSVMAKEVNQNLLKMEQRLSEQAEHRNKRIEKTMERHNERVEKRLKERNESLMKTLREIQETKGTMQEYREEIAAAREKKKPWWKFW